MRSIYIVACSKEKEQHEAPAKDLYISKRFKLARKVAEAYADQWFILSTKYGLLEPNRVIVPYDQLLLDIDECERKQWAKTVQQKLEPFLDKQTHIVCLGSKEYFREISSWLVSKQTSVFVPSFHLPESKETPWLQLIQKESQRARDIARLYGILQDHQLRETQFRHFRECSGSMRWPQKGLYLFYQCGFNRILSNIDLKIMRIGTHAVSEGSSSSLWQRLKNHKGKLDLSGNHRGSIFRLYVGAALIKREGLVCPSWGIGQSANDEISATEVDIEKRVSEYIQDMMLLCLRIEDAPSKRSDRAYIEQNMIALLAGPLGPVDIAQESWLGYHCPNPGVRRSSLWNVDYTHMEYDPSFFEILQTYVDVSVGRIPHPAHSLAPRYWHENKKNSYRQTALNLG